MPTATPPSFTGAWQEPADYFSAIAGTYTIGGIIQLTTVDNVGLFFDIISVTISTPTSAVPEPSTYAALAGLAALGFAASRRRLAHA